MLWSKAAGTVTGADGEGHHPVRLGHWGPGNDTGVDDDAAIHAGGAGMDVRGDDGRARREAAQLKMEFGCSTGDGAGSIACHVEGDLGSAMAGILGVGDRWYFIGRRQTGRHHDW